MNKSGPFAVENATGKPYICFDIGSRRDRTSQWDEKGTLWESRTTPVAVSFQTMVHSFATEAHNPGRRSIRNESEDLPYQTNDPMLSG